MLLLLLFLIDLFTDTVAILNKLIVNVIMGCPGGQTKGSVSVLLCLISFYFDRLKYFCISNGDKERQKAIVVPAHIWMQ